MDNDFILFNFITHILNVDKDMIDSLATETTDNGSIQLLIKLKFNPIDLCPVCNCKGIVHSYNSKSLIHSIFANRKCVIIYRQRRYKCKKCNLTFSEHNPFAKEHERLTYETKSNILFDLKRTNVTYNQVAQRYDVSPTEVLRIFDKHVNIEPHTLPIALSIDEHYFPTSDGSGKYIFILMDFIDGSIIDIYPDRRKDMLISKFSSIKNNTLDFKTHKSELNNVKYISMDMNEIYRDLCKRYFYDAIIAADSFHVIKNLNTFFDNIRKRCRRNCNDDLLIYALTKFNYVLSVDVNLDNESKYNKRFGRYINHRGIREYIFDAFPELKEAYYLKENYIMFNRYCTYEKAAEEIDIQIKAFSKSNIPEYYTFKKLLENWRQEIINSFIIVDGKRINNSYIESRNKQISNLFMNANGFINFKRTRNRIMYCINKNDTYKM